MCPKSYATHATLQSLPERWRGLDLRSASGKMLKIWGMREVVYNAVDLQERVFTVKIPFVVCEVRRPLLSLAMLEDKGFHMTVKDGCRKLGGHGREMNLQRQGNSYLVDVEFRGGLLEKRKRLGSLLDSWLLWTVVWQVFLPLLVWTRDEQLPLQHPKCPVVKLKNHIC